MGRTDLIQRQLLAELAAREGFSDLREAADLLHGHWDEATGVRGQFFLELRDLLLQRPMDMAAIKRCTGTKGGIILGGHSSTRAKIKAFFDHDRASQLIKDLIGDGSKAPDVETINSFVNEAVAIAFHKPGGKGRDASGAALLASVLLTSLFPDTFVDFRLSRWQDLVKNFELEAVPPHASYGERLYWAGRVARQFASTPTFQRYFQGDNPNWIVAGFSFMFSRDAWDLDLVGLINQVRGRPETELRGGYTGMEITPEEIWQVLQNHNPQVILQGPPGSGKTFLAERVIEYVAKTDDIQSYRFAAIREDIPEHCPVVWEVIQFHPSYSYEDFVRGLVTEPTDQGIVFRVQDRILAAMARAAEHRAEIPFILILDEINRADLARVLGELIYTLERDRRGMAVSSQYAVGDPPDRTLRLPLNLYLVGTMNTADRSIALVDYAIRRRFSFFSVLPRVEVVEAFYSTRAFHNGNEETATQLGPKVVALYQAIYDLFDNVSDADDIRIGHSYFLVKGSRGGKSLSLEEWADAVAFRFAFEVVPMLSEYRQERRLLDRADEVQVGDQRFSLQLSGQNATRQAIRNWLAQE